MSTLKILNNAQSIDDIAKILGYKASSLSYILYKIKDEEKYTEFKIPKKGGGERTIKAPTEKLKLLQRQLATLLNKCIEEIYSGGRKYSELSHGFRAGHSIVSNAKKHVRKRYVFNIDLKDFFQTINFGRLRGYLIKDSNFSLNPKIATIISQIACHDNSLPQGSPCSPVISNLIGHIIDVRLVNLAKNNGCTYSRYADDITFSTNLKVFPSAIAIKCENSNLWQAGEPLKKIIGKLNFVINEKKCSMQYKTSRQTATGLVVNKKVNINKYYYKKTRAMCHSLYVNDNFFTGDPVVFREDGTVELFSTQMMASISPSDINVLIGRLSFIEYIKRGNACISTNEATNNICNNGGKYNDRGTGLYKIYKNTLLYKHFISNNMPTIITEGKTDITYLKCALKNLNIYFNNFTTEKNGTKTYKIKYFKFTENFKKIVNTSEGTGGIKQIMIYLSKCMKHYRGSQNIHPVFFVIDNDGGAGAIKSIAKDLFGVFIDNKGGVFKLKHHFYLVVIPRLGNRDTNIEDLFEESVLRTTLEGKTFQPDEKLFDPKLHYSKQAFAENVIIKHQKNINFSNFKPIFEMINQSIAEYDEILRTDLNI